MGGLFGGGGGGGYMPAPYDGSKMQAMMDKQANAAGQMMAGLVQQKAAYDAQSQNQIDKSLAASNEAQKKLVDKGLFGANRSLSMFGRMPTYLSPIVAQQQTKQNKTNNQTKQKYQMPDMKGLMFK